MLIIDKFDITLFSGGGGGGDTNEIICYTTPAYSLFRTN